MMKSNNFTRSLMATLMICLLSVITYQSLDFLTTRPSPSSQTRVLGAASNSPQQAVVQKANPTPQETLPLATLDAASGLDCNLVNQFLAAHCSDTAVRKNDAAIPCSDFRAFTNKYCASASKLTATPSAKKQTCEEGELKCISKFQFTCQDSDWKFSGPCPVSTQ